MASSEFVYQRPRSGPKVLPPTRKKLVTASLDFGTAYTGYSFSFNHAPMKMYANTWEYGGYTKKSSKAPSTVLLNKDGRFHSFGFEAEEKYDSLTENDEHPGWYHFEKFKMKLYSAKKLTLETTIRDIEDKEQPAALIFTMVIKDIKRRLLETIKESQGDSFTADDVFWILTVPAIWSDSAKHFMHVAANKAGITSDQLRLVLEPEAASFYCQTKCTIKHGAGANVWLDRFPVGFRYVILDLGGGTVDIATHEVIADNDLREIFTATGDALGSCRIDEAFLNMMETVFGPDVMRKFKQEDRGNYRIIMSDFEEKKRKVKLEGDSAMKIRLPQFFSEIVQTELGHTIKTLIDSKKELKGRISITRDKLGISSEVVKGFFEETVSQIVETVNKIVRTQHVDAVLAVGGFSESQYVKQSIKKALKNKDIKFLAPEDPGYHVMYGATLTNIFPNKIVERISRYSYGFRVQERYDENRHEGHKEHRADGEVCPIVYHECITIGRRLKYNETISFDQIGGRRDTPGRKNEITNVEFWCSDRQNTKLCLPKYGCKLVGTIEMIPPEEGWPDEVHFNIQLRVGEAEFCITVIDKMSGKNFKTNLDFLRDLSIE